MFDKGLNNYITPSRFYEYANEYKIDAGYALATFIWETGWGNKSTAWTNGNNPAGIMCEFGYCHYGSAEEGFEAMFELLRSYVDGSIDYVGVQRTADEVRSTWSVSEDVDEIIRIWNEILREE